MVSGKPWVLLSGSRMLLALAMWMGTGQSAWAIGPFGRIDVWPFAHSNGSGANATDSGDVDNDSDIDVVATYGTTVGWYKNLNGDALTWWQGSSPLYTTVSTAYNANTVFTGDMDGDGDLDIVGSCTSSGYSYLAWFENTNNGATWMTHLSHQVYDSVHWVEPADIDGDGDLDLSAATYGTLGWLEMNSGSPVSFHTLDSSIYANFRCAHVANLDSDSELEITGVLHYGSGLGRQVCIYEIGGGRTDLSTTQMNAPYTAWHGDFDGDGDNDVAAANGSDILVWRNDSGTWTSIAGVSVPGFVLRSGDFDNDGTDELVAGFTLRILQYNGSAWTSTTVDPAVSPMYSSTAGIDVADVDLDGDLDIVGPSGYGVYWWGSGESAHFYNPYGGYGGGYGGP